MNVMGDGAGRRVNAVRTEVRRVPFEGRAHFRIAARARIIRHECRPIDPHDMR